MEALAGRMKALLGPFVLRRLKSEVASQLVLKQQRVRACCLGSGCDLVLCRAHFSFRGL